MANLLIYIFILCIYNSILFYGKHFGVNFPMFIIPFILFIIYALKTNNKIKNKKGLLFILPITIISFTYLIYNNLFFNIINIVVITLLFILMYIFTIKPTLSLPQIIMDTFSILFEPLDCIDNLYNSLTEKIKNTFNISTESYNKLKSFIIIIPIILVILLLLNSADMMVHNIFKDIFKIFNKLSFKNLLGRILIIIILFTYIGSLIIYLISKFDDNKENINNQKNNNGYINSYTIKLLLTILNIIYIIFDIIQIRSLIFHKVATNINYAEYAREGFFQLMFISLINLIIILISKHTKDNSFEKYNKIMSIIMIILNFVIIYSSFMRMYMYENMYGYTLLRLLVYFILITEVLLFIPTIIYVINPKIQIIKSYIVIICAMYTILSLVPIDYIIANNNINRYYKVDKIDFHYLKNNGTDNIPLLIKLYNKTEDKKLQDRIEKYLIQIEKTNKINGFQEYNLSKNKSLKLIKKLNLKKDQ